MLASNRSIPMEAIQTIVCNESRGGRVRRLALALCDRIEPGFAKVFIAQRLDDPEFRGEPGLIPARRHYTDTSKINSSSTGVPRGRLATPYTSREGFLSFPKTSCSNSEAPSAIVGCYRISPEVATNTPSRTIRVTLSSDPKCCRATARLLSAAR